MIDSVHMTSVGPGKLYGRMVHNETSVTVRPDPPMMGSERESLRGWLDYHRATLAWKCDGLGEDELRQRSMPPSTLTLLGLVRHMAEVERHWFRRVIAGETIRHVWSEEWDFQAAYDAQHSTRGEAFTAWQVEIAESRRIEEAVASLDDHFRVDSWECDATLRTVLLHLIHDYARHNGHADFLRQGIDGTVGA
jgi:uncharacterized damage-inducible protein DinB